MASGNMGTVYSATQVNLNRKVAIKVLFESTVQDQDFLRGFFREAQAAAAFTHQNIVQAYDVGQSEDELYYFAMELVDGGDVLELIKSNDSIIYKDALPLMTGIAEGLHYGNSTRQLTHGDLKPANILITRQGEAKLADLGLARMGGEIQGESDGIMLTPMYAAPEMILDQWENGDPRADIYSFGATLYHMLAGHPPFEDPSFKEILRMQIEEDHIPLKKAKAKIPQGVSDFVDHLLEKDLHKRPQTWAEVLESLQQLKLKASVYQRSSDKKSKSKVFDRAHADNNKSKNTLIAVILGFFIIAAIALTLINIDNKNTNTRESKTPQSNSPTKEELLTKPPVETPPAIAKQKAPESPKPKKILKQEKREAKLLNDKRTNPKPVIEKKKPLVKTPKPAEKAIVKIQTPKVDPREKKLTAHLKAISSLKNGNINEHIKKISTIVTDNSYAQNLSIHFYEALEEMKSYKDTKILLSTYDAKHISFVENKLYGPVEEKILINSKESTLKLAQLSEELIESKKSSDQNVIMLYALTQPKSYLKNKITMTPENDYSTFIDLILKHGVQ
ncbi:protein kinase [Lentisphaera marina]|nr:protein kinase [Lentisphaera marina]MDD7984247.1 protein kinase [Lentisphaera marina]